MIIREARKEDIPQIQIVRNSVKENMLSDPNLVTNKDCEEFLFERGKGWVCEINSEIVGFSIVDLKENNIWALFLHPDFKIKELAESFMISCLIGILSKPNKMFGSELRPIQELKLFTENPAGTRSELMEKRSNLK